MTTTNTTSKPKVTRCQDWANGLGFDCTVNGVRFQVVSDRAIGRLVALRENSDHEITHSLRIHNDRSATWIAGNRNVAEVVYWLWHDYRIDWTTHVE